MNFVHLTLKNNINKCVYTVHTGDTENEKGENITHTHALRKAPLSEHSCESKNTTAENLFEYSYTHRQCPISACMNIPNLICPMHCVLQFQYMYIRFRCVSVRACTCEQSAYVLVVMFLLI